VSARSAANPDGDGAVGVPEEVHPLVVALCDRMPCGDELVPGDRGARTIESDDVINSNRGRRVSTHRRIERNVAAGVQGYWWKRAHESVQPCPTNAAWASSSF